MANIRIFKDIDLNFTAHPITGDIAKKVGDDAIIQSMMGLLSTGKYERLLQPTIYSDLKQQLFEPLDNITASAIRTAIISVVNRHEPRVDLTEINVAPDYDNNGYSVSLTFFILNQTDPITIEFFLERVR